MVPALLSMIEEMTNTYSLEVLFEDDEYCKPLDSVMISILFRAVAELLIYVARHANVNVANISTHREGNRLTVRVKDRGAGFASNSATNGSVGFGLATLRERIAHIGGSFQIKSALNRGTTATIQVPLAEK